MVEIPNDREAALDIVWACIHDHTDRWDAISHAPTHCTRSYIASDLGWSYSTVYRLVKELEKRKQVTVKWDHQHQSYWEGGFRCAQR